MPVARRYLGSFSCSAEGARLARRAIKQFAANYLSGLQLVDFETAIGEALANTVEHSAATTIDVRCLYQNAKLITEIEDDGRGFLPPPAIEPPPAAAARGFGLFIMHQLVDELEFLNGGKCLRLVVRAR